MQIKVLLKKKRKKEVRQILEAAIYLFLKLCCQFSLGWRSFFKQFGDANFIIFFTCVSFLDDYSPHVADQDWWFLNIF